MTREYIRQLARLGAARRLADLSAEITAIVGEFPELETVQDKSRKQAASHKWTAAQRAKFNATMRRQLRQLRQPRQDKNYYRKLNYYPKVARRG